VAISPDGKTIASGSTDKTVRLWDVTAAKELATLEGHTGEVESLSFSADGKWLLSASSDKTLRVWDVAAQKEAGVITGHLGFVLSAAMHPKNQTLVSASGDHSVRLWRWNESSGKVTGTMLSPQIGHGGWVVDAIYSPDGDVIASANVSTTSYWVAPGEIHLYGSDNGYPYALLRGHTRRVTSLSFSQDGKLLASGSADGSVRIWGVAAGDSISASEATIEPTSTLPAPVDEPATSPTSTDRPATSPTPTDQPATPTIPANLPKSGNLALRQVTTTSKSEAARPSDRAVDGSTSTDWGSGDFPPQWIEIDLGAPATVKSFRLLVTQYPNGTTIHSILLRSPDGEFTEVHRFEQFTSSGQWLIFRLPQPMENIQFVRIETTKSPSWVGWVEIEVIGER
jgi:WD40 repeat protein